METNSFLHQVYSFLGLERVLHLRRQDAHLRLRACAMREQKSELTVPSAQSPGLVLQAVESFCLTEPLRTLPCKDIIDIQVKIHLEVVRLYMQSLTREMCVQ